MMISVQEGDRQTAERGEWGERESRERERWYRFKIGYELTIFTISMYELDQLDLNVNDLTQLAGYLTTYLLQACRPGCDASRQDVQLTFHG